VRIRPLHLLDAGRGRLCSRHRRRHELSRRRGSNSHDRKGVSSMKARCSFARYICSTLAVVGFSIGPS
jgi:hypothetical protein